MAEPPPAAPAGRLEALLAAVEIRSPQEYRLGGTRYRVPEFTPEPFGGLFRPFAPGVPALVGDLQQKLYEMAYVRPFAGGARLDPPPAGASLVPDLTLANATRERWEGGWQVAQVAADGSIWARKEGLAQSFAAGRYAPAPAAAGAAVEVLPAKGSAEIQPGFYHAFGEIPLDAGAAGGAGGFGGGRDEGLAEGHGRLTRIYFHLAEEGAAPLVHAATTLLNRFQVPFRMKALAYRGAYTRADSAVLFFAKRHFPFVARLLPRWQAAVGRHLRPAAPLLTKCLADGIAVAEDPADGESFGTSRCRLIAQALWEAHCRGAAGAAALRAELAAEFRRHGLDLERPWLRAGSADIYRWPGAAGEAP